MTVFASSKEECEKYYDKINYELKFKQGVTDFSDVYI